jgi:hypothetical protein
MQVSNSHLRKDRNTNQADPSVKKEKTSQRFITRQQNLKSERILLSIGRREVNKRISAEVLGYGPNGRNYYPDVK